MRVFTWIATLVAAAASVLAQGTITTVAGSPTCCNSADGGSATSTWLPTAEGMALDRQGDIYIWDAQSAKIKKVSTNGIITTVAGNGTAGYSGDGGPATSARIFAIGAHPGLAVDNSGNLYISDSENNVIRKVDTGGIITTVAGNGTSGFSGDGGKATQAQLFQPAGIVVDASGNLYIADNDNNRVRKVSSAGIITTVAGNGHVVYEGDGVQAATTAVHGPVGLAVDNAGNLYISEGADSRIRKVDANGIITTVAGQTKKTRGFSGDGGPATAATLASPIGLAVDGSGNLFIADSNNNRVRKVNAAGIITTVAGMDGNASTPLGDGGPATSAFLGTDTDVALDAAGNLYISGNVSDGGRVRKVTFGVSLSANPSSLSFSYTLGGAVPAQQSVTITSSGAAADFTASASTTSGGNWLSVSPANGTSTATLQVSVNPAGLASGVYAGAITVTSTTSGISPLTFAVTLTVTGANAPTFSAGAVLNASGYQSTLAPDTVFVIFGKGLGPSSLVAGSAPNYPEALAGTSVTFTPASGGAAVTAKMVYTTDGQIAGLLPSSIAPGTYAVRVTYNTLTSAPQNVTVVAHSFGIATANSAGTGTAQATIGNVNNGVSLTRFTPGNVSFGGLSWALTPAHPGDTLVLWGTGGGADAANDTGGTSGDQTAAGQFSVLVNGRAITPLYAGASSGYPGLWQINFQLPGDIATGCFTSLQVNAGGTVSNSVTIPIAAAGAGACSDPQLSQADLATLDTGGTIAFGGVGIVKTTATSSPASGGSVTTTTIERASGDIGVFTADAYGALFSGIKVDACAVTDNTRSATAKSPGTPSSYLDAGPALPLSGPGLPSGTALTVAVAGPIYGKTLTNGTLAGGTYTLTGNGGKDVGPFSASAVFPASFSVGGWDSLNTIDRTQPLTISWSGGGDMVTIIGTTNSVVGKDAANSNLIHTVEFTCTVPASRGSYTIPTEVLQPLLPEAINQPANGSAFLTVASGAATPLKFTLLNGAKLAFANFTTSLGFSKNMNVK